MERELENVMGDDQQLFASIPLNPAILAEEVAFKAKQGSGGLEMIIAESSDDEVDEGDIRQHFLL